MQTTRRYWVTVAVAGLLALWAGVLERPVLLVGTAGIMGWLLGHQYRFVRNVVATVADLTVDQQPDRERVPADETTTGSLQVRTSRPVPVSVQVSTVAPVGTTRTETSCRLDPGETQAACEFEVTWPVAGSFEFDTPTVTVTDPLGLFRQTTTVGSSPTVTVEPRGPSAIHVGEGGTRITTGFGEHDSATTGQGFTPTGVRRYLPEDSVKRIDWNATARLNEPYVREFEGKTDLQTALVVDHRATMATGSPGQRKLDFARQVALAIVADTSELSDQLACYTVGDEGLTNRFDPSTATSRYRTIERSLRTLEPTSGTGSQPGSPTVGPARARRTAAQLPSDTRFGRRLRPFFEAAERYVERITDRPLFHAVETTATALDETGRVVVLTDDRHRGELLEAVKAARTNAGQVAVFLCPTVLYEQPTLTNVEETYQQYTDFERFRQEVASLPRVSAYEVGPADRLQAVLAAGRTRRRVTR